MNKEEILNRLIQKSICINAGGKGCYSPYTNDMDWFSDIDNLILMYEQLQRENKKYKEVIDKLKDLLIIKKARCLNEDNYVLNIPDLDDILQVLKEVE